MEEYIFCKGEGFFRVWEKRGSKAVVSCTVWGQSKNKWWGSLREEEHDLQRRSLGLHGVILCLWKKDPQV